MGKPRIITKTRSVRDLMSDGRPRTPRDIRNGTRLPSFDVSVQMRELMRANIIERHGSGGLEYYQITSTT